jgi:hypothetical protein
VGIQTVSATKRVVGSMRNIPCGWFVGWLVGWLVALLPACIKKKKTKINDAKKPAFIFAQE